MKKLMLVAPLLILVSCGKDSGGSSGNPREKLLGAISAIQRGQTSQTITEGNNVLIHTDGSVTSEASKEEDFSVVLKIDGSNVYKYEIEKDMVEGTTDIEVTMTSYDQAQIDKMLQTPGISLNGNMLAVNFHDTIEYDMFSAIIKQTYTISASINLAMPLCESYSHSNSSGTITSNGTVTNFGPNTSTSRETCGPVFTADQMKDIDLTSVTFCDETQMDDENYNCESNKDMSWLTADL